MPETRPARGAERSPEPSNAELLDRLASADRTAQRTASEAIGARLGQGSPEAASLRDGVRELLTLGEPRARFAAAFVLFRAERPTLRLLPALLDALDLDDGDLRWSATHMLATLGRMQGEVLAVLLHEAAAAESARRRRMALYALRELAPERAETRARFLAATSDRDAEVRRAALTSFAKLVEPDAACVERTLTALDSDPDPRMRRIAATLVPDLLAHHPDAGARGRAALEAAARADDPALARSAGAALGRLPAPQTK